jgi:hypothetical protein
VYIYKTLTVDILNFISWIKGGRKVTTVDPAKTLLPVGLKDGRRDDDYLTGAITVQDFANLVGEPSVTFVQGSLEAAVQATMTAIGGTITFADGSVYKKYRVQGITTVGGLSTYAPLIGVVVGSDELLRVREDSVILAKDTNVYDTVASAMNRSAPVSDGGSLNFTSFTAIVDDNTISAPDEHWFTLVMTAGAPFDFDATVIIDFTIAVPIDATVEFFN